MGDRLNAATKYVATHRPESLEWGPFEGVGPDIVEGIRRIKSQDGPDLILSGSSTLTSTLLEQGLADEVVADRLSGPVGHGETLLCRGNPGTRIRARQHTNNAVRRHPQHVQGRRAFEDRIGRACRFSVRLREFALPSLAALALPLLVIAMACGVSNAAAQTDAYPRMAAIGQYQMEESAEIQLARSAAPNSISGDATILVLRRQGYETAVQGKNGFVCMVAEVGWLRSTGPNSGTRR